MSHETSKDESIQRSALAEAEGRWPARGIVPEHARSFSAFMEGVRYALAKSSDETHAPASGGKLAGWYDREQGAFLDIQNQPSAPGTWIPLYMRDAAETTAADGLSSVSIEPRGSKVALILCFDNLDAAQAARPRVRAAVGLLPETKAVQVCAVCAEPWKLGHRCKPTEPSALKAAATPDAAAEPEYESVGWQYRYPSIWGPGHVWLDHASGHNGNNYDQSREIFAKRSPEKTTPPHLAVIPGEEP